MKFIKENTGYLIGAIGAIIAALILVILPRILDNEKSYYIPSRGSDVLTNNSWKGHIVQKFEKADSASKIPCDARFWINDDKVSCTLTSDLSGIIDNADATEINELSGRFVDDSYIIFDYVNVDQSQKQFGSIILKLSETADSLNGHFLGFGPLDKKLVKGDIKLCVQ